jgi:hypothetical protein
MRPPASGKAGAVSAVLRDALRALAEALPPGAPVTVTVPREELLALLATDPGASFSGRCDTEQAGRILGVRPKTVSHWCTAGRFPGARKVGTGKRARWTLPLEAVYAAATGEALPRAG